MSWRDQLRPASFRGVPFFVVASESELGRRTVVHEYPQRDRPGVQDLGLRAQRGTVEAVVLGEEYFAARDALRAAFNRSGPGRLVHPYYGELDVSIESSVRLRETTEEGGAARFTFTFVQTTSAKEASPSLRVDPKSRVRQLVAADVRSVTAATAPAAPALVPALVLEVERGFDVDGFISEVRDSATLGLQQATEQLRAARRTAQKALGIVDDLGLEIDAFRAALDGLLSVPAELGARLLGLVVGTLRGVKTEAAAARGASSASRASSEGSRSLPPERDEPAARDAAIVQTLRQILAGLLGFAPTAPAPGETPAATQRTANHDVLVWVFRCGAVAAAADAVVGLRFESYEQAVEVRADFVAAIDSLLLNVPTDDLFEILADLKGAIVEHLTTASGDLPRVSRVELSDELPAVVVAFDIHADSLRDAEIVRRNGLRHPLFVPALTALEVLADE